MWPHSFRRRILCLPHSQQLFVSKFQVHTIALNALSHSSRPQLPFLQVPVKRPVTRLLSTETKEWLKKEVKNGLKYSVIITSTGFLLIVLASGVQEEYRARIYPTPDEWNWNTRLQFRAARAREDSDDPWMKNWMAIGASYKRIIEKLQDPNRDGQRVREQKEGAPEIPIKINGRLGFDISQNSEPWRRGYYEVLMGLARVAEHLYNHVKDKSSIQHLAWPSNTVYGPSNPRPKPVSVGMPPPPPEESCTAAFEAPEVYYNHILTTRGFTQKQKVDAAISYGLWLNYNSNPELAQKIYQWALDIAISNSGPHRGVCDPSTGIINVNLGCPSENVLAATTALGIHYATNSNIEMALPIFISILRARRSLSVPPPTMLSSLSSDEDKSDSLFGSVISFIWKYLEPPKYPPPPNDGSAPPYRDVKGKCEEAGIMLYIGEILYASKRSRSGREEGLAWTREAVDSAEAELRQKEINKDAKKTCQQCLEIGLQNWAVMVDMLANEEREKKMTSNQGWLNFGSQESVLSRWESEKEVIQDRIFRANNLLTGK